MTRRAFGILLLLAATVALGAWLGRVTRAENYPLTGSLQVVESGAPDGVSRVGDFVVAWENASGGQLTVRNRDGKTLWQTVAGEPFLFAAEGNERVTESRGMFRFEENLRTVCTHQRLELILDTPASADLPGGAVTLSGHLFCNNGRSVLYNLYFEQESDPGHVTLRAWLQDPETYEESQDFNRVYLTYAAGRDEHFFGFGEQFTHFDMKGKQVPVWVSEQGVGRGEQPITTGADLTNGGAGGNAFTSYAPMPFYLSSQMRSLGLANNAYSLFDFRTADRVQVTVHSPTVIAHLYDGESPAGILEAYTADKRMQALPEWVYTGAIVGMQGGTDKVLSVWEELAGRNTPVSAFWLQDWVGQRKTSFGKQLWWNWEVDDDRYPRWQELVAGLQAQDVRVLVYASPYLADIGNLKPNLRRNLFQEAARQGYLVRNKNGEPYLILNTDFYFGMLDLTNPNAWEWYKQVLKEQVAGSGARGWMADFGEGLPYDAVLFDGDARIVHNQYPVLWAKLNREVVDELGGDHVFFNRAAYTQSPAFSTLFWEGDQLVSWSEYDGMRSAITGLNTAGLSGMAFNHSDIGGYTTVTNPLMNYHRSRELLQRWMEMNAFTLVFRTHEGNQPDNNVQFYTDAETLDTFAYWAKVYAALFEYRRELVNEATATGLPVVRHPFLHYPDDPETWKITYQEFMLGPDFLIAPVTEEGAVEVTAYLPPGRWVHLWSGEIYAGGRYVTVPAPIGQPGVFYLQGSTWGQELRKQIETGPVK